MDLGSESYLPMSWGGGAFRLALGRAHRHLMKGGCSETFDERREEVGREGRQVSKPQFPYLYL